MLYGTKNPHGGDVYGQEIRLDFSANVNPLGTPPEVTAAICEAAARVQHYPDPYCRALTAAISAHEGVPEGYILCGNGAAELIYNYCDAIRPAHVAELAPTFLEYAQAAEHFGARVSRYALCEEKDFLPDAGLLPFLERERPDVLFLCTPNNPSGKTIPRALLKTVLALCAQFGTRVFLDECFLDFTGEKSAKELLEENPHLFILKAFTKNYALAGVRVGYGLTGNKALLSQMAQAQQPWNVSVLAQAAGVAALQTGEHFARAKALIVPQRAALTKGLQELGFRVISSEANYLLFRAPAGLDKALRREGIAIRNCENYAGLGAGWYRIAVRLPEENNALLAAMRRGMEDGSWR